MLLCDVARFGDRFPEKELSEPPHRYDVVWREHQRPLLSHVFEVQDKGNIGAALAKLQHAWDYWQSFVFIVITDERDRRKLDQYACPRPTGTYHRLDGHLVVFSSDQVRESCTSSLTATGTGWVVS